jgi:hypothetical protein
MRKELLNGTRCMWIVCLCLVLSGMIIVGCGGSSSDHSQTWKDKFPTLWSTAYAAEGDEPNPEDITYDEFLQAVVSALKADETFQTEICPITPEELDALVARVAELETKLASVSVGEVNGYSALTFSGVNVHILSGSGSTDETVNGLGNLIVGYNGLRGSGDDRSGSHNIVVGDWNNYSSYGGLVAGYFNSISGVYSSVIGGRHNAANGQYSSVSGGDGNIASGWSSSVSGGQYNTASIDCSSVSGGYGNTASGGGSSVSGGMQNTASGNLSSVSGGWTNTASGVESSVSGGRNNTAIGYFSSVSGGNGRSVSGDDDWRAGTLLEDQ